MGLVCQDCGSIIYYSHDMWSVKCRTNADGSTEELSREPLEDHETFACSECDNTQNFRDVSDAAEDAGATVRAFIETTDKGRLKLMNPVGQANAAEAIQ